MNNQPMHHPTYTESYRVRYKSIVHSSAVHILPVLFKVFCPKRVIDLGWGSGEWLKTCEDLGSVKLVGLEGTWLSESQLLSPNIDFFKSNFQESISIPGKFDLAISTEVAEHLTPKSSLRLIDSLCEASDIVVFSAAIPNQGYEDHFNEQWQTYWQAAFLKKDYLCFDIFRSQIWNNPEVAWWYKQNLFLFVRKTTDPNVFQQFAELEDTSGLVNVVHPDLYIVLHDMMEKPSLNFCLRMFRNYFRKWMRGG